MATDIVDGASPAAAIAASTWIFMERPWMRSIFRGLSFCEIACEGGCGEYVRAGVGPSVYMVRLCMQLYVCMCGILKEISTSYAHTHTTLYWMQRCFDRPLHAVTSTVSSDMPAQYVHFATLTVLS